MIGLHSLHFELDKILHDKMSRIYVYQAILSFVKSLIGIFVPVYLYKCGYSIVSIVMYSLGVSLFYLILIPLSVKLIKVIGFKYTILLSTPIYLLHIALLNYVKESSVFFHLSWISFGVYVSLFWPAFHSEVAMNGSNRRRASQIGTLQIITTLVGTAAPIVGGFMLDYTSYWMLFALASFLILIGVVPLLFADDIRLKCYDFNYKDYINLLRSKKYGYSKFAFSAEGLNNFLIILVWPVVVFILLDRSFLKLGVLVSVVSFLSVILILYLKSFIDNGNKNVFLRRVTRVMSFAWFFKSVVSFFSIFFLYFLEGVSRFTQNVFNLLFSSIFYNNAKKVGYMNYIILSEFCLHISKIFFGVFIIVTMLFFGESLKTLCFIAFSGVFISFGLGLLEEIREE